jgi:PspA associated protein B
VGLLDVLTGRSRLRTPAPERLFAITTAYITLQTSFGIEPTGEAAIVFQPLATAEFEATMREMETVVTATGSEQGTRVASQNDSYGYRWMVVRNPPGAVSVEDLAVAINAVSGSIEGSGHGERLLCSVFAFTQTSAAASGAPADSGGSAPAASGGRRIYFIYNYKRGFWYPFVPAAGAEERSNERELQLKAQIGSDLPIEPKLERWFPLWGIPI